MKLYFAGSYTRRELDILAEYNCAIMQNWSTVEQNDPLWMKLKSGAIKDVIFDSGGFQLQTHTVTKRQIGLEHYALWLELILRDYPNIKYLCLDILGDNAKTLDNLAYLEEHGLHPIPIWHSKNSEVYDIFLDYYCDRYEYIALGGIAMGNRQATYRLMEYISQRYPHTKFHLLGIGFALSRICEIYHPFSADASSWLAPARWGQEVDFIGNKMILKTMSEEDRKAIRKNDDVRTEWSRKTIYRMKEFEKVINKSEITVPLQGNMFA